MVATVASRLKAAHALTWRARAWARGWGRVGLLAALALGGWAWRALPPRPFVPREDAPRLNGAFGDRLGIHCSSLHFSRRVLQTYLAVSIYWYLSTGIYLST